MRYDIWFEKCPTTSMLTFSNLGMTPEFAKSQFFAKVSDNLHFLHVLQSFHEKGPSDLKSF